MLPELLGSDTTDESFSFGKVAHPHSTHVEAYLMTYNFIVSNIIPVFALNEEAHIVDMLTEVRNTEDHRRKYDYRYNEFADIFKPVFVDIR